MRQLKASVPDGKAAILEAYMEREGFTLGPWLEALAEVLVTLEPGDVIFAPMVYRARQISAERRTTQLTRRGAHECPLGSLYGRPARSPRDRIIGSRDGSSETRALRTPHADFGWRRTRRARTMNVHAVGTHTEVCVCHFRRLRIEGDQICLRVAGKNEGKNAGTIAALISVLIAALIAALTSVLIADLIADLTDRA